MKSFVSTVILTKNSEKKLPLILKKLEGIDEIVVLDTGSEDKTCEVASQFKNVSLYRKEFSGFGPLRNEGALLAQNDWILALDSDELPSDELVEFLLNTALDPSKIYSFPFKNFYKGRWIRGCNWYPDRHNRLYHKKKAHFSPDFVHEKLCGIQTKEEALPFHIHHTSYDTVGDFLDKMQRYSTLFAQQNAGRKRASFSKALLHGCFSFFKSYLLKRGFLDGQEGFIISFYNGATAFYKYLKLAEYNKNLTKTIN